MRAISIDFSPRAQRVILSRALLAIGFTCVLAAGALSAWDQRSVKRFQSQITALQTSSPAPIVPESELPVTDAASRKRFAIAASELSIPWDVLFQALESARPETVTILAIEPDARGKIIRIRGQAANYTEALGFVDRLSTRSSLKDVFLANHQFEQPGKVDGLVKFSIESRWGTP